MFVLPGGQLVSVLRRSRRDAVAHDLLVHDADFGFDLQIRITLTARV